MSETIDRLKELYEKTTQGEWKADTRDPADCVVYVGEDGFVGNIGSVITPVLSEEQITDERVRVLFDTDISNAEFIAAIHNDFPRIVKEVAELEGRKDCFRNALESLTPLGSEYYNNPDRCVEYVKDFRDTQHKMIVKFKTERDALQRENAALQREAEFWKEKYRNRLKVDCATESNVDLFMAALESELKQEER